MHLKKISPLRKIILFVILGFIYFVDSASADFNNFAPVPYAGNTVYPTSPDQQYVFGARFGVDDVGATWGYVIAYTDDACTSTLFSFTLGYDQDSGGFTGQTFLTTTELKPIVVRCLRTDVYNAAFGYLNTYTLADNEDIWTIADLPASSASTTATTSPQEVIAYTSVALVSFVSFITGLISTIWIFSLFTV